MDGTKCEGLNCPLKEMCYRYTAKPSEYYQSYFTEIPFDVKTKKCAYLWERK